MEQPSLMHQFGQIISTFYRSMDGSLLLIIAINLPIQYLDLISVQLGLEELDQVTMEQFSLACFVRTPVAKRIANIVCRKLTARVQ